MPQRQKTAIACVAVRRSPSLAGLPKMLCLAEPGGWLSGSGRPLRWPTGKSSAGHLSPTWPRPASPSAGGESEPGNRLALEALANCDGTPPTSRIQAARSVTCIVDEDGWREEMYHRGILQRDAKNPRTDFKRIKDKLAAAHASWRFPPLGLERPQELVPSPPTRFLRSPAV
jgi:hypothetical protein